MFVFAFSSGKEQQEFFNSDYNVEAKSSYSIAGLVFTKLITNFLPSIFGLVPYHKSDQGTVVKDFLQP
jgi:hypothetical protein